MSHHPSTGGNNGEDEHFPEQNESKSKCQTINNQSRNPKVNNNSQKSTSVSQRSTPSNLPVNTGATHIFYKTRICQKFAKGNCRNGDKCTFAHGPKDLHEPPSNWHELVKDNRGGDWNDDEKIIQRMRICRKFYNGDHCPFGEKCTFLHQSPDRFKVQLAIDSGKTEVQSHTDDPITTEPLATSSATDDPITTEPLATSSATDVPVVSPVIGRRGFVKLANKKLVGIYADWIDDGDLNQNH